jgi:hypothetical protein
MSQPRRRRRRHRRGGQGTAPRPAETTAQQDPKAGPEPQAAPKRPRRRRSRARSGRAGRAAGAPARSSEDIVRDPDRAANLVLTAVPDGRTLEGVIGELQSEWGVPQNPQEYRITLKVAEERNGRAERRATLEEIREEPEAPTGDGAPRREKAPAAPRIGAAGRGTAEPEAAPARRKRPRRRRRKGRPSAG